MHVPVLKQGDYLIASVQAVLSDTDLIQLRDDLAERVGRFRSRGVIIDVTVLDIIDSFATRTLRAIAHMLKLRGAETVTWLGVGNVEARLFRAEADISHPCEHILLRSGVAGLQLPALQASLMPLAHGDLLVFATDGIQAGFDVRITLTESPRQMAESILSRNFKGTDGALVLVARYTGMQA